MRCRGVGLLRAMSLAAWTAGLSAQSSVPTPGTVGDTLEPLPQLQPPPEPAPIQQPPRPPQTPPQGGTAVPVQSFSFSGNTVIPTAELQAAVQSYVGRSLTLLEIYDAAEKITETYVRRGYTLASVNVPAQKVDRGTVLLEVIEGRVASVRVEGNKRYRPGTMMDYLTGVRPPEVYRGTDLEASLNQLNELPGLSTRAILRPGGQFGTSDVIIEAREDSFEGLVSTDNYGRESTGEFRFTASGTVNNPLTLADKLQFLGLVSEDALLKYGFLDYSFPLGSRGPRLSLSYGYADFEVDDKVFDGIDGSNQTGRAALSLPLLRDRSTRLLLSVGVSNTQADSDLDGVPLPRETDITLFELGTTLLHTWPSLAYTQLKLDMSSNFATATIEELNADGGSDDQAFRAHLGMLHLEPLPWKFQALLSLAGAWTPDPLVDTEQFSVGGPGTVRGYPASDIRGDRGYFGSLTLRRPFIVGPLTVYGSIFADSGKVFVLDAAPGVSEEESLSSVGTGFEIRYRQWSAKLDASFPTDNHLASDGRDDYRLFGALSVSY